MGSKSKLLVLVLAITLSASEQTDAWELGHPDAKLLMGVDLKSLRESSVGQSIREQMLHAQPAATGAAPSPFQASFQAMAFGILDQIDRVFLSSPANAAAGAKNNPPFLLVVEGRFPMAQLAPFLQGPSRAYRGAQVYRTTRDTGKTTTVKTNTTPINPTSVALLDGGTLLLGDEKSVLAALDRRGRALPSSALLARAQSLASTHDFWAIADAPLSKFQPASASPGNPLASPLASQIASQIKGIETGLSLRDGFQFELNLATDSEATATQMSQLVSGQIQMAMLAQATRPEEAEMVRKLQIGAEGNRVHVNIALTADEFRQLQAAQAARAAAAVRTPQPPARPAKPATPGKIIIYGLDGGPREIQTTH
jgi:hypothetical protein